MSDIIISPGDRPGARSETIQAPGLGSGLRLPKIGLPKREKAAAPEKPAAKAQPKPEAKPKRRKPRRPPLLSGMQKAALTGVGVVALLTAGFVTWHSGAPQRLTRSAIDGLWALTAQAGFSVTDIQVTGRERTPPADILRALEAREGTPILGVDLEDAKDRLEAVPSVRTATIERRLPHALKVTLTERKPVALWQHDGEFMLVDKEGRQIPGSIDGFENLLLIVGDGAPIASIDLFAQLAREPAIQARVKAAVRVGNRRWNLRLDDAVKGLEVRLPEDDVEEALHHLAQLEGNRGLSNRRVAMVDLRLPDRLVVKTAQEQAQQPADASALNRRPGG